MLTMKFFYGLTKALNVGRPIKIRKDPSTREIGTVIRLQSEEGFGFLREGATQTEYYFKIDQIASAKKPIKIGDKVSFEIRVKYDKLRAELIKRAR